MFPLYDENPTSRPSIVVFAIIAINVLVFLWQLSLSPAAQERLVVQSGFVPARLTELPDQGPVQVQGERLRYILPPDPKQIGLSAITSMFLHGSVAHILGNLWFFWIFGNNIEDRLGHVRFLIFYLLGGLLAVAAHWQVEPNSATPVIGASGAIAAVLGSYAVLYPWARIRTLVVLVIIITVIDLPALVVLGAWFLGQYLEATRALNLDIDGGVAWIAHLGGFVAGAVLTPVFILGVAPPVPPRRERWLDQRFPARPRRGPW